MKKIDGGATIWARKTIDSVIFYDKPADWFKIWFFIVNQVNHKEYRKWGKGQGFMTYSQIMEKTKTTKNQVDMCFRFLKKEQMLTTQKTTRGMTVKVLNYQLYQDLNNYKNNVKTTQETKSKRNRNDTINKNDNNDNNIGEPKGSQNDYDEIEIVSVDEDGNETKPKSSAKYPNARKVIETFWGKEKNKAWKVNRTQRYSAQTLYEQKGMGKIKNAMSFYKKNKNEKYCPSITSPSDLLNKWEKLLSFRSKKLKNEN